MKWKVSLDAIHVFYRLPKDEKSLVYCHIRETNNHFTDIYSLDNHLWHPIWARVGCGLSDLTSSVTIKRLVSTVCMNPIWCQNQKNHKICFNKCETNDHYTAIYPLDNHSGPLIWARVGPDLSDSISSIIVEWLVLMLCMNPICFRNQKNHNFCSTHVIQMITSHTIN